MERQRSKLPVNYYRIRRRLAFTLPMTELVKPAMTVAGLPRYPWGVWIAWALEERILSLGWSAQWFEDHRDVDCATRDLAALADWPRFDYAGQPDLALAAMVRVIAAALREWSWVDSSLRDALTVACSRMIDQHIAWSDQWHGPLRSVADVMSRDVPFSILSNIPVIGGISLATAAQLANHPRRDDLNARAAALSIGILRCRQTGFTEGVCYDGYVLDFIADWLIDAPTELRDAYLSEPGLDDLIMQAAWLSQAQTPMNVAPLGDVEPVEMPFHASAAAKMQKLHPTPLAWWYLNKLDPNLVRTDGLAAIAKLPQSKKPADPPHGRTRHLNPAVVLRHGWADNDMVVAVSLPRTIMGHLHDDAGSLAITSAGRWLITDPGYQQYMQNSERESTIGPQAHNAPVLNGFAQNNRAAQLLCLSDESEQGDPFTQIDMTDCYPKEAGATRVVRSVWQLDNNVVVVADSIETKTSSTINYHWHGHEDAAWQLSDSWCGLYLEPATTLWFTGLGIDAAEDRVKRLRGSRGPMTYCATASCPQATTVWWIFSLTDCPPDVNLSNDHKTLTIAGRTLATEMTPSKP